MVKSPTIVLWRGWVPGCGRLVQLGHWLTPRLMWGRGRRSRVPWWRGSAFRLLHRCRGAKSPRTGAVVHPVRIQGGVLTEVNGSPQWLYVSESGRIMTTKRSPSSQGALSMRAWIAGSGFCTGPA